MISIWIWLGYDLRRDASFNEWNIKKEGYVRSPLKAV